MLHPPNNSLPKIQNKKCAQAVLRIRITGQSWIRISIIVKNSDPDPDQSLNSRAVEAEKEAVKGLKASNRRFASRSASK
jgi:hypothetical protein